MAQGAKWYQESLRDEEIINDGTMNLFVMKK
jgi:hypothetical protein